MAVQITVDAPLVRFTFLVVCNFTSFWDMARAPYTRRFRATQAETLTMWPRQIGGLLRCHVWSGSDWAAFSPLRDTSPQGTTVNTKLSSDIDMALAMLLLSRCRGTLCSPSFRGVARTRVILLVPGVFPFIGSLPLSVWQQLFTLCDRTRRELDEWLRNVGAVGFVSPAPRRRDSRQCPGSF